MEKFSLDELLRYGLAGGVMIAALFIAHTVPQDIAPDLHGVTDAATFFGAALLTGSLIYVLHRAIIYPFIFAVISCFFWPDKTVIEIDFDRWNRTARQTALTMRLGEWASQVHYLYCSAWGVAAALILGWLMGLDTRSRTAFCSILIVGIALFFAAAFHHWRYLCYDRRIEGIRGRK